MGFSVPLDRRKYTGRMQMLDPSAVLEDPKKTAAGPGIWLRSAYFPRSNGTENPIRNTISHMVLLAPPAWVCDGTLTTASVAHSIRHTNVTQSGPPPLRKRTASRADFIRQGLGLVRWPPSRTLPLGGVPKGGGWMHHRGIGVDTNIRPSVKIKKIGQISTKKSQISRVSRKNEFLGSNFPILP